MGKKIGGMKIYNEMQLRTMLEKVGFCDIKSFVDAKKHWLCIVAKEISGNQTYKNFNEYNLKPNNLNGGEEKFAAFNLSGRKILDFIK